MPMATLNMDTFLDSCAFLSRKQLANLELTCASVHAILEQTKLPMLHFVYRPVCVFLPSGLQQQQQQQQQQTSASAAHRVAEGDECKCHNTDGFFMVTEFCSINEGCNNVLYKSNDAQEVPPLFVRCSVVKINDMADARVVNFLERAQHIFEWHLCNVDIVATLQVPIRHWSLVFSLLHSSRQIFIKQLLPDNLKALMEKRDAELVAITAKKRSNEITAAEEHRRECKLLLEQFLVQLADQQHVWGLCAQTIFDWLHCRCGKEGGQKRLHVFDEAHVMVGAVHSLIEQMHNAIQSDVMPLDRWFELQFSSIYAKDMALGTAVPASGNRMITRNERTGERLTTWLEEISCDLSGALYLIRRPNDAD